MALEDLIHTAEQHSAHAARARSPLERRESHARASQSWRAVGAVASREQRGGTWDRISQRKSHEHAIASSKAGADMDRERREGSKKKVGKKKIAKKGAKKKAAPKAIQTGKKGGKYVVTPSGQKVYLGRGGKGR